MRLLLDTHTLLWWLADDPKLNQRASDAISRRSSAVFVSAASAWEIAIKQALAKLEAPSDLQNQLELNGFEALPITVRHAYAAGTLPPHHDDPFDRMLVAQAMAEGLTLVTKDPWMDLYPVTTLRA